MSDDDNGVGDDVETGDDAVAADATDDDTPVEPAVNISGGDDGGRSPARFEPAASPATRAEAVVDALGELYWQSTYGGQDAFECLVRTILSQNTSDQASQPAHDSLVDRYADGEGDVDADDGEGDGDDLAAALADADEAELAETIRSAGLYNQKSRMIVGAAEEILEEFGGAEEFDEFVVDSDPEAVRERLLAIDGVGPKTADCVLLFAGGQDGVFPVDTHVHRIARRMGLAPPDADHETVRAHLERDVPGPKCGFGHTAMIQFGREHCTARKPACLDDPEACPLAEHCERVGVDVVAGEVVDPAEAVADD